MKLFKKIQLTWKQFHPCTRQIFVIIETKEDMIPNEPKWFQMMMERMKYYQFTPQSIRNILLASWTKTPSRKTQPKHHSPFFHIRLSIIPSNSLHHNPIQATIPSIPFQPTIPIQPTSPHFHFHFHHQMNPSFSSLRHRRHNAPLPLLHRLSCPFPWNASFTVCIFEHIMSIAPWQE